ncbi:hypothetical protein [Aquisalimonas sp.]|uniref:NfeD family protein n=1 Tax=Aquisalimonas sp. TaxID=1872621 RepID=UPI0025C05421|nr:hypothetical protein [Aquisalimonas sp.]
MELWAIWLMLGIGLLVMEVALMGGGGGLLVAWALMCSAAMVAALLGASLTEQLITAGVVGLLAMPGFVWLFRQATQAGAGEATTPTRVTARNGSLGVVVRGDFFRARHVDGRELQEGEKVLVERYEGLTAIVKDVE